MTADAGVRVVVDARIVSGEWGGVENVVIGLATGLSGLDGPDEYLFLTYRGYDDWLAPHVAGSARLLTRPPSVGAATRGLRRRLKASAPALARLWGHRPTVPRRLPRPPASDGTIERAEADVVHFTVQSGFITNIPSVYHPHDLQHVHLPRFFTPAQRRWRDGVYGALARQARMVAVASTWTKRDVQEHLGLPEQQVVVVPLAPATDALDGEPSGEGADVSTKYGLPPRYILYPAQTWPHKNHLGLLDALHLLRSRGVIVPLVATGQKNEFFAVLRRHTDDLALGDQVVWTGFVPGPDLRAIYHGATAVVIPSRFEAASFPLWEAFAAGIPAAASNVTSLPDQAGDAALVFDPGAPVSIADAISALWLDADLRQELAERGRARVREFTWDRTARTFRAHYRRIAGRRLSEEDIELLNRPPGI